MILSFTYLPVRRLSLPGHTEPEQTVLFAAENLRLKCSLSTSRTKTAILDSCKKVALFGNNN